MTLSQIIGYLFLIFLGVLWTRAGYMTRKQANGITNILFYVLLPFLLLHYSQTDSYESLLPAKLLPAALICMVLAILLFLLDKLPFFRTDRLTGPEYHLLYVEASIITGFILSFFLYRFRITLPVILSSPFNMLYATVMPVSMFLIGHVIAGALGLTKGGRR